MKPKTIKIHKTILQSNVDWDFSECFNSMAGICHKKELEQLTGFLIELYENKRCILRADGIL